MKNILVTSLIILVSACSTPHIQNSNNTLKITIKDKTLIHGEGKLLYKKKINLLHINIQQKVYLMKDGSVLTYEDASLSTTYMYRYGMKRTIGIIFPQYNYDLIDTKGNIFFFKLSNKSDNEYVILENINNKRVKFIYGFNQNLFQSIFESLMHEKNTTQTKREETNSQEIQEDKSFYIKSSWSHQNIILDTLMTKSMKGLRHRM